VATFNVIGYHDPFTEMYVCYCYEWNIVGTGSDSNQALDELAKNVDYIALSQKGTVPLFLSRQRRRIDIDSMFASILIDRPERVCRRRISSGHNLDVYHFTKDKVAKPVGAEQTKRDTEEYQRSIDLEAFLDLPRIEQKDIPF